MKKFLLIAAAILPGVLPAQQNSDKKETERIIITKKGNNNEKMNIVVDGDNITVNGKPVNKDDDADITVRRMKIKDVDNFAWPPDGDFAAPQTFGNIRIVSSPNKAMLGVITGRDEKGVKIKSVTKGSAADKAGLKEGDIITDIDREKIESPDQLSEVFKDKKPGDKITIVYTRNGKQATTSAELTKWSAPQTMTLKNLDVNGQTFNGNLNMENLMKNMPDKWNGTSDFDFDKNGFTNGFGGNAPKLGIKIQEEEAGTGVKVLNVDKGSDAERAGLKEGDIIKEANGKVIDGADDIIGQVRKSGAGSVIKLKVNRNGSAQNVDVKLSKKIKSANL